MFLSEIIAIDFFLYFCFFQASHKDVKKLITIFEQNKSKNLIHLGNKSLFRQVYVTTLVDWDFSMTIQQMKFHFFFTMMSFWVVNHPSEMWYVLFSNYFKELTIFWDLRNLSFQLSWKMFGRRYRQNIYWNMKDWVLYKIP